MKRDPTARYGLDLRQAVIDRLGLTSETHIEDVLAAACRHIGGMVYPAILIEDDTVTVNDPGVDVAAALREAWAAVDLDAIVADLRPRTVALTISGRDFERLTVNSTEWSANLRSDRIGDFLEPTTERDEPPGTAGPTPTGSAPNGRPS